MAEHKEKFLAPPVLAAIKNEEVAARVRMERTASQEIREERQDLKDAAEQSVNVVIDLGMDGTVRWVSPTWRNVIGTPVDEIQGKPITNILYESDTNPFMDAVDSLKQDDSRSHIIRFRTRLGRDSVFLDEGFWTESSSEEDQVEIGRHQEKERIVTLEGQGIMVYDRGSGGESHVSHNIGCLSTQADKRKVHVDASSRF